MSKINFLTTFLFLFLSCNRPEGKQLAIRNELSGTVIKIVDGDTFDLLTHENKKIRIRMNGIDCPERKQDFYQVAKDALGVYIFQKEVELITYGKDRYGRIIANVFSRGQNINLAMVRDGYAWHYKKYSSDTALARVEKEAKVAKRGLWQFTNPTAPWEYRQK